MSKFRAFMALAETSREINRKISLCKERKENSKMQEFASVHYRFLEGVEEGLNLAQQIVYSELEKLGAE